VVSGAYELLHSPAYKSLRWPQGLLGQPKTGCKFLTASNLVQKNIHLHHANIITSCADLQSEISPALCNKKCCSEHLTLFAHVEGLGMRLVPN